MSDEPLVFPRHARMAGICARGSRGWFAAHGLDWTEFTIKGLPADVLEAFNDPIVNGAVAAARKEADERRG